MVFPGGRTGESPARPLFFHSFVNFSYICHLRFQFVMKNLLVPFVEGLESMSLEELAQTLELKGARQPVAHVAWSEFPYAPIVSFNIAASQTHLFVLFFVRGLGLKALFGETNEPVWQDSCVEVFIADPDGCGYRNFEMNCIGTLLSAHQKARGKDVVRITPEQAAQVIRLTSLEYETFPEKEGLHEWSAAIGIPFSLLGCEERPRELKANFYKCADGSSLPHYVSWAPIDTPKPDFHRPEFFGTLTFEQPTNR